MATERITIIVDEKGVPTVKKSFDSLQVSIEKTDKSVDKLSSGFGDLRSILGGLTAYFGVSQLIQYSDAATRLGNSLRLAGLQGQQFADIQGRIYQTAIQNGQSAEQLGVVYQKLNTVSGQLGITSNEVIGVTEGIAAAMKLSTASTQAQEGALQQLGQALGGNVIQAQEYNSLIDGAYPLLQAVANGIDRFGGSVAALTAEVKQGGFSTQEFFNGLQVGLQNTQAIAAQIPLTIGQSFVALQQAFQQWLATSNAASASARILSSAIQFLAANIDTLVTILIPVATYFALAFGASVLTAMTTGILTFSRTLLLLSTTLMTTVIPAVISFTTALAVNPLTLWVAAIGAVISGLALLYVYLTQGEEGFQRLYEAGTRALEKLKSQLSSVLSFGGPGKVPEIKVTANDAAAKLLKSGQDSAKTIEASMKSGGSFAANAIGNAIQSAVGTALAKLNSAMQDDQFSRTPTRFGVRNPTDNRAIQGMIDATPGSSTFGRGRFASGGQFDVGGTGGTDSQAVGFMASPNERVTVETPAQQRRTDAALAGSGSRGSSNVKIYNLYDPSASVDAMNTRAGQDVVYNTIKTDPDAFRRILGL